MAVDIFLKLGDVVGESKDAKHPGEIIVCGWRWGMSRGGPNAGSGTSTSIDPVNVHDITIAKEFDKASPTLMMHCFSGRVVNEAKLTVRRAGKIALPFLVIFLKEAYVSSVTTDGNGSQADLTELVTLGFRAVKVEYTPQKQDGSPDGGVVPALWDIPANRASF